jgi:tRNA A37 methylthiotransferase MiaB
MKMQIELEKADVKSFYVYAKKSCPRRSLEATALAKYLVANGLLTASKPKEADLIFIYTCGGFNKNEASSLFTIKKAVDMHGSQVIVTGCLPKIIPDKLKVFPNITIISPDEMAKLDSLINAKIPYSTFSHISTVSGIHDLYNDKRLTRLKQNIITNGKLKTGSTYVKKTLLHKSNTHFMDQSFYRLEIAKGCLGNCSYCAIKLAMPKFHSFPPSEIIENFRNGLNAGYKNFALIAGDIGCYGVDIDTNLPKLLEELFKVKGDYKVALVDFNVRWLEKNYLEFLEILKSNSEKILTVIMPIQSGSNKILKLMNRHYEIDNVKRCILDLKENIPELFIETHIMVGFPGETEEDFSMSIQLVKEIQFSRVHVYTYEERPGTLALSLSEKVPREQIDRRVKILQRETKTRDGN